MTAADDVLAAPLSVLGLNIRATNALLNNGFSTVGDVVAKTERELLWQLPGVGQGTLTEIKAKLGTHGLERFPLGLNRDSQGTRKGGVLAGDSAAGMRHDQALFDGFAGSCG